MPIVPTEPVSLTENECIVSGRPFRSAEAGRLWPAQRPSSLLAELRRELDAMAWTLVARLAAEHAAEQERSPEIPLDMDEGSR